MPVRKVNNYIEAYRLRALSKDINDLSGRNDAPDLTKQISEHIVNKLYLEKDDVLIDVGCGDGTLLCVASDLINGWLGRLIGILPTLEETLKVQEHISKKKLGKSDIAITLGLATKIDLPNNIATKVVSNGVFLLLDNEEMVDQAILEIHRISKPGALVFIGEVPDNNKTDFTKAKTESIKSNRLNFTLLTSFFPRVINRLKLTFSKKLIVVAPQPTLAINPKDFIKKLESFNFSLIEHYACNIIFDEQNMTSGEAYHRRWNYIAIKK